MLKLPLGRAGASPKRRSNSSISDRAMPCPRCRATPEVAASTLRYDGRSGPLGGDRDRVVAPIVARGPASSGAGDREIVLLVAVVAATPDAPQRGDREICKLFVFSSCCICFWVAALIFSEFAFPG
jgi:hypothetical protein